MPEISTSAHIHNTSVGKNGLNQTHLRAGILTCNSVPKQCHVCLLQEHTHTALYSRYHGETKQLTALRHIESELTYPKAFRPLYEGSST